MTQDINTVLFYLAGKNYFNGAPEINRDLHNQVDYQPILAQIEAMGLLHTKTENHRKVYLLRQFAKDGMHNLPQAYSQDPYAYFKELDDEKQRIVTQHLDYVGNLTKDESSRKQEGKGPNRTKWFGMAGIIAATIALLRLKRRK